ncbi:MAG: EAL domain-containing protein [Colwellia polaris]|jgi:diguanylate cyclase (GGDEF)-like protein
MRIRSYLALLVCACLLGAYALEQVLTQYFVHVQTMADKYNKNLLWAKDLERIEISTSQFLVSSDLVVGSGNTYLIFGAKNIGDYLTSELSTLHAQHHFPSLNDKISHTITQTTTINSILDAVGQIPPSALKTDLRNLLDEYDPVSLRLSNNIMFLTKEVKNIISQQGLALEQEKQFQAQVVWLSRTVFFLFIIVLWWWANRRICRPLDQLINSSHKALAGEGFNPTINAPTEIIKLSNDFKDITESLFYQASHDPLTELQNRRAFERCLTEALPDNKANYFLCFIDLDYFKTINDSCGHAAGDDILIKVANILKNNIRYKDTVARLGGDEFAILLKDLNVEKAMSIANKVKSQIHRLSYTLENEVFYLSASIGIAQKTTQTTISELLHCADVACAAAKNAGRNIVKIYDINFVLEQTDTPDTISVHQINQALENDLFLLFKQEIMPLKSMNSGKYFEVLLMMKNAAGKIVQHTHFTAIADRYQLSIDIDRWLINKTYQYFTSNYAELTTVKTIAIKLSSQALLNEDFEGFIVQLLKNGAIPADKFCFEVQESDAIAHLKRARIFMTNLRASGCEFALNEVGKGHYSCVYMNEFPVNIIKISSALIKKLPNNNKAYNTVTSICANATLANQRVVAKSVDDENMVNLLNELGVDFVQGNYSAYPEELCF